MKKLLAIAFAAFMLSSCTKDPDEFTPGMKKVTSSAQQFKGTDYNAINESLDDAALIVAMSLNDQAVRSFIKSEALKQFDGDYDILYQSAKNIPIDGRSLENIFSGNMSGRFSGLGVFENVISNIRNFQISVPVYCDKWNSASYTPLVAISDPGADEKTLKQVKAYDSDGNVHWLDALTDPSVPVIVVGISERVDDSGRLKYAFEQVSNADDAARTNGQNTKLGSIKCPDLSDIEPWIKGKPELRLRVCGAKLTLECSTTETPLIVTTKYYNPDRSDIDGEWYDVNTSLFNWYRYWESPTTTFVYGSDMKFYWVEEDGGKLIDVDVNIYGSMQSCYGSFSVSAEVSFDIGNNDEDIGDAVVYYGDPTDWYVYSTGDQLKFEID